jgi:hypothetical protein
MKLKRVAAEVRSFANCRWRILLASGNINWQLLNPAHLLRTIKRQGIYDVHT